MLEPIQPNDSRDSKPVPKQDKEIDKLEPATDSEGGFRFNFFKRSKKRKQKDKNNETGDSSVYNEDTAVNVNLSEEARKKMEKMRRRKQQNKKGNK